jgi:hypothetical protein
VLTVEDWAEVRRLHRAEGMPVGPVGALVGAWPPPVVGSFELLMPLRIRTHQRATSKARDDAAVNRGARPMDHTTVGLPAEHGADRARRRP